MRGCAAHSFVNPSSNVTTQYANAYGCYKTHFLPIHRSNLLKLLREYSRWEIVCIAAPSRHLLRHRLRYGLWVEQSTTMYICCANRFAIVEQKCRKKKTPNLHWPSPSRRRRLHPSPCHRRPYPPLPYKLSPPAALRIPLHQTSSPEPPSSPSLASEFHYLHLIRRRCQASLPCPSK